MATHTIKEIGNVFSRVHYNSIGRILLVLRKRENGYGVVSLQSVLVGNEHSLHFHLQLEGFCACDRINLRSFSNIY